MNSSRSQNPDENKLMAVLIRLIRRVCILREQDQLTEAQQVEESDLANTVRDLRLEQGPGALSEEALRELFLVESRRVADAAVISELLIPRLVQVLPTAAGSVRARPVHVSAPARGAPLAGPPGITDLLDAMLAAERPGHRSSAAVQPES
jgi:hypothetical protein